MEHFTTDQLNRLNHNLRAHGEPSYEQHTKAAQWLIRHPQFHRVLLVLVFPFIFGLILAAVISFTFLV